MFRYPPRFVFDVLFLLACLTIPACALMEGYRRSPSPPCVDMSQATLQSYNSTEIQRLPPVYPDYVR